MRRFTATPKPRVEEAAFNYILYIYNIVNITSIYRYISSYRCIKVVICIKVAMKAAALTKLRIQRFTTSFTGLFYGNSNKTHADFMELLEYRFCSKLPKF